MEAHVSVVQGSGERRRNRTIPSHPSPLEINFGRRRNPLQPSALGAVTASARRHPTGPTRRVAAGTPPQSMPEAKGRVPISTLKYFRPFKAEDSEVV